MCCNLCKRQMFLEAQSRETEKKVLLNEVEKENITLKCDVVYKRSKKQPKPFNQFSANHQYLLVKSLL